MLQGKATFLSPRSLESNSLVSQPQFAKEHTLSATTALVLCLRARVHQPAVVLGLQIHIHVCAPMLGQSSRTACIRRRSCPMMML